MSSKQVEMMQLRGKLLQLGDEDDSECPLCGFDYQEKVLLVKAIEAKTELIKKKLDGIGRQITQCYQGMNSILNPL
ncbi:hypothetical protein HKB16_05300, partial [Vibrio parahaemolyticus]|nr:hypothetical protein [Vibrio parahaemolyticus]